MPVHVDPKVTDPRAARYQAGLPKYNQPAGGPKVPIPMLDQPHDAGHTMAEHAVAQRRSAGSIVEPPVPQSSGLDIRPTDLLPAEAQADPAFQPGHGSMYASAQPHLARKYGVVRAGKPIGPHQLSHPTDPSNPAKRPIEATMRDLQTVEELRAKSLAAESGELQTEKEAKEGPAGGAENIGTKKPVETEEPSGSRMTTEFDLNTIHEMMVSSLLNSDEQRAIIEARCKAMDLGELIVSGKVRQVVPIQPGIFEPEFQSLNGLDDLHLKRLVIEESKSLKVDDRYLLDKFSLMGMTCSLFSVNGKPLMSYTDKEGDFNEDAFWKKFKQVASFPLPMLTSLGVNYFWFDIRVRKLFVAQKIKNG